MRTDLYSFVHKAQRFHMFCLSTDIGATDFSSTKDARAIAARVKDLFAHLKDHANNEQRYIHPLFQRLGDVGDKLNVDHGHLHQEMDIIERILHEQSWDQLYSAYAKFLGIYLLHLDEEKPPSARFYGRTTTMTI